MTMNTVFNELFDDFQADEFFSSALYSLSWDEVISGPIDRITGDRIETTTSYSCDAFLVSPSVKERWQTEEFANVINGDIAALCQLSELVKIPPPESLVTFRGEVYKCKEYVRDGAEVSAKLLLRK